MKKVCIKNEKKRALISKYTSCFIKSVNELKIIKKIVKYE